MARPASVPPPQPEDHGPRERTAQAERTPQARVPHDPAGRERGRQELVRYLEGRFACAQACEECARACARRRLPDEPCHASRLNTACADVCDATFRVLAEPGEHGEPGERAGEYEERVRVQVEWCRAICHQCAALCDTSTASARCAEACRRCARACDDFLAAMD